MLRRKPESLYTLAVLVQKKDKALKRPIKSIIIFLIASYMLVNTLLTYQAQLKKNRILSGLVASVGNIYPEALNSVY